jgi:segregation and condensation protein A
VIPVKLEAFEGPLDLLLHLIDKNKVNIYDIPIVEITKQYMEYIQEMKRQDLDVMSEFLVMAATLLDIKSRMLLPKEVNEEGEEEDPRQELVEKLLEYKLYKYMSYELRERQQEASLSMYKDPTIPEEVKAYRPEVKVEELLGDMTLRQMHKIFQDVMKRQKDRIDPIRNSFGTLEKEEVDMDATWERTETYILEHRSCSFRELLAKSRTKMQIVVTFLVILELMKLGRIKVIQEELFSEIYIAAV